MIISHQYKFIFIAIPKTGTHAIRFALRKHMDEHDWEQVKLFKSSSLPIPELARLGHGHISLNQIRPHLTAEQLRTYFKFAIVRNPYDRFLSSVCYLHRLQPTLLKSPKHLMKRMIQDPSFMNKVLCRPQSDFIIDQQGQIALDYVGQFSDLQNAYEDICQKIGLPSEPLEKVNTSSHPAFEDCYDDEIRKSVELFYQKDFELIDFG